MPPRLARACLRRRREPWWLICRARGSRFRMTIIGTARIIPVASFNGIHSERQPSRRKFGKDPWELSVADQTRAAIWEYQTNPRFAKTKAAMEGSDPNAMINQLVRNYESPRDPGAAINTRSAYYAGFNPSSAPTTAAPVGLSITTPAAAAEAPIITDSQVFAARQRIANGSRDPADAELVKRYLAEQNAPAKPFHPESGRDRAIHHQQAAPTLAWPTDKSGNFQQRSPLQAAHEFADSVGRFGGAMKMAPDNFAPTYDDAARHVLKSLRGANDNRPVKVDITDGSAERIGKVSRLDEHMARALGRTAWHGNGNHHVAGAGERAIRAMSYATNITTHHHHDHTSDTKIGQITVHTQATDGRGVAADIGPALRRNSLVTQANGALA